MDELDVLLTRSAATVPTASAAAAVGMAREVRQGRRPRRLFRSRRSLVAGAAVGVLALSGAGTLAAYQLSIPPFQTIPPGVQRAAEPVEITYAEPNGRETTCLVFLETMNVDREGRAAIAGIADDPAWTTFGRDLLRGRRLSSSADRQELVMDAAGRQLRAAAEQVVPDLVNTPGVFAPSTDDPVVYGVAATCDSGRAGAR